MSFMAGRVSRPMHDVTTPANSRPHSGRWLVDLIDAREGVERDRGDGVEAVGEQEVMPYEDRHAPRSRSEPRSAMPT
jgi:hypothetical protein